MSAKEDEVCYYPIGVIHSPYKRCEETPNQGRFNRDVEGRVELYPQYEEGLKDIEGFSHIILLYSFHLSTSHPLLVIPFRDDEPRGVFATRSPRRPNNIGMCIVELTRREGNILHFLGVDVVDGTPLLDIKPYVPSFDESGEVRIGWLTDKLGDREDEKYS